MGPTPGWNRGGSGDDHRVMRAPAVLLAVPFLLFAAACGDDDESSSSSDPADCTAAVDGEVTIVADALDWAVDCLPPPAGEPLTVPLEKQDDGVTPTITFQDAPENTNTDPAPRTGRPDDRDWEVDCLTAPSVEPLTVIVDNQDEGVNHNIHFTDAPEKPKTELEAGPVVQELEVDLEAGEYRFVCDIHPNMVGTLTMTDATSDANG